MQYQTHVDGEDAPDGYIFVFGSNLAGRHGRGAAKHAALHYGAQYGCGQGPTGMSYAIPTKGYRIETLPLSVIAEHAKAFIDYARDNPDTPFFLTRVGCVLAGYTDAAIAPLFIGIPVNVNIPREWAIHLGRPEGVRNTDH